MPFAVIRMRMSADVDTSAARCDQELTAAEFDAEGWFHTGDIGLLTPGDAIGDTLKIGGVGSEMLGSGVCDGG